MGASRDAASVLLVHGAFHGAWCWERVTDALAVRGVEAHSVELPFTSLADDAETVSSARDQMEVPVVVVGHSYGGAVITTGAGGGNGRRAAEHLVYVAALMADPDQAFDLTPTPAMTAVRARDGMSYFDPDLATAAMYHRCAPELAAWATSMLRPMPAAKGQGSRAQSTAAWRTIPSTYVVCSDDRAIHPEDQRRMAALAGTCIELDADHSPFLSTTDELADVLAEAARTAMAGSRAPS